MAPPRHRTALVNIPGLSLLTVSRFDVNQSVPLSRGGRDDLSNLQWLPKALHQEKTRRDLRP